MFDVSFTTIMAQKIAEKEARDNFRAYSDRFTRKSYNFDAIPLPSNSVRIYWS
jgi:hypothetical protein